MSAYGDNAALSMHQKLVLKEEHRLLLSINFCLYEDADTYNEIACNYSN